VFVGNFLNQKLARAASDQPLPAGPAKLRGDFVYDGGGLGKGGKLSLFVGANKVGEARLDQTQAITLGLGGTLDVGADTGTPVDEIYTPPFEYGGKIQKVTLDLK
jgi:arylsulfatase